MKYTTSVTQKGQATIPLAIRKRFGIRPRSKVVFEVTDKNEVLIKPVQDFFTMKGSISTRKPFDIDAMDKAVLKAIKQSYAKKHH